jgi:hypothetical protein
MGLGLLCVALGVLPGVSVEIAEEFVSPLVESAASSQGAELTIEKRSSRLRGDRIIRRSRTVVWVLQRLVLPWGMFLFQECSQKKRYQLLQWQRQNG